MAPYTHILAAVELHEDCKRMLEKANSLALTFQARLSIVHVVEYLPLDPAGDLISTLPMDSSAERAADARARLEGWCRELAIPVASLRVAVGGITAEILDLAKEIQADLILVGHYPRRGLSALFAHTEEGVVHKAACDVLALHLGS
jgi:universal stress protein A